jgi:hypothetical protein
MAVVTSRCLPLDEEKHGEGLCRWDVSDERDERRRAITDEGHHADDGDDPASTGRPAAPVGKLRIQPKQPSEGGDPAGGDERLKSYWFDTFSLKRPLELRIYDTPYGI